MRLVLVLWIMVIGWQANNLWRAWRGWRAARHRSHKRPMRPLMLTFDCYLRW